MGFDIILKSIPAEGLVWETKFCSGYAKPRFVYTSYLYRLSLGVSIDKGVHTGDIM